MMGRGGLRAGGTRRVRAGLLAGALGAGLVITPASVATAAPPPDQPGTEAQTAAQLQQVTGGQARVASHRDTGLLRFVGTTRDHPIPRAKGVSAGASPEAQARGFLATYGPGFGITDAATQVEAVERGGDAVALQQVHGGVPVMGGELRVKLDDDGNVLAATGEISPDLTLSTEPTVTKASAAATVRGAMAKYHGTSGRITDGPSLWIYDPELLGGPEVGPARLVWRTSVQADSPEPFDELVLIDATTGGIALQIDQLEQGKNRFVCDRNNVVGAAEACTGSYARVEGQAATGNTDVDLAYEYSGDTYDYYQAKFGRDSLDNAGLALRSTVRFCPSAADCSGGSYQNAYWNGAQMVYGAGFAAADDVVGHELSHGVTDFESHLFYYYQSGAINESLSDVFGELIDLQNGKGTDTAAVRWKMGEDLPSIGAIRDMANPGAFGDPDRVGSASYYTATADSGGVHTNSGINNKAAFLMTDGGTFNGRTVTALGADKTAHVYYETATNLITSAADYNDLFDALQQGCTNLVGSFGITAGDCVEVGDAVAATEMNLQPPAAASITEAPVCAVGQTANDLFNDDLENTGSGNWVRTTTTGSQAWSYPQNPNIFSGFDATYATSGSTNFFGGNRSTASNTQIARTGDVVPPAGKTTYLRFRHAYGLESTWDGGRVEYSTNGGGAWTDAGALFTNNGYQTTMNASSPMPGNAFSGVSHGYYSSRINLTSLAGQNVRFRFRLASDSSTNVLGWFIDDVRVYTCDATPTAPGTPTIGTATRGDAQANLTWTAPASDGGSPITGYVVTPYIGVTPQTAQTFNSTATTQTVTGLTNGTAYYFRVAAKNAVGTGTASAASNTVTPATTPGAPTGVVAAAGDGEAAVGWSAPASNGGDPITGYVVTPYIGASAQTPQTFNSVALGQEVTGLTNGTTYTFKVAAINGVGTGPESDPSNPVTPVPAVTAPGAPTIGNVVPGNGTASASWTAPVSDGGSPVTGYVVTPYIAGSAQTPQTFNSTATTQTVTGLTNGTTYTFTVAAKNAVGTGAESGESAAITIGVPGPPGFPAAQSGNGQAKVAWFGASTNGSAITGWVVTPFIGSAPEPAQTAPAGASSLQVTGLTNGVTYTFHIQATNARGTGLASVTNPVTVGSPSSPVFPSANPQATGARVGWGIPAPNAAPIQGYVVTPYIGSAAQTPVTFNSTAQKQVLTGLTSGVTYTFKVSAFNSFGTSPPAQTGAIIVGSPETPGFPAAVPGNGQAIVRFYTPSNSGSAITGYTVWPVQGSTVGAPQVFNTPGATQLTVTGLTNGLPYSFRVAATNAVGTGPYSTAPAITVGAPTAPGFSSAQPGDGTAKVSWLASNANGSPVTSTKITPYIGTVAQPTQTFAGSATSQVVTGLTNGTTYTFKVASVNAMGTSPLDTTQLSIKVGTPTSPSFPRATPGNGSATVTWNAPAANAAPITGYVITPYIGTTAQAPQNFAGTATSQVVTGLANGTTYTFRVSAINSIGTGPYGTVAALKIGIPGAPAKPTVVAGSQSVTVNWIAPADNGSAITGYVVTAFIGGVAQAPVSFDASATSRVISGLTPGVAYTFTVAAVNARGQGAASTPSAAATPTP